MDLNKIVQYGGYGLVGLSALFGILFFAGAVTENGLLIWTYILIGLAAAATVIFSLANIVSNPKAAVNMLISMGVLAVLVIITYFAASNDIPTNAKGEPMAVDPGTSQWVGGAIGLSGTLLFIAIAGIFSSPIFKLLRK